jgi:hypothetical protein
LRMIRQTRRFSIGAASHRTGAMVWRGSTGFDRNANRAGRQMLMQDGVMG